MDSRLRRTAIFFSLLMVLLVGSLVVFLNRDKIPVIREMVALPEEQSTDGTGREETQTIDLSPEGLSAFMKDETFFDQESSPPGFQSSTKEDEAQKTLSLLAHSVQKDLRVQILNQKGELATGESFFITLKEVGEYKDVDKDGIIYIGDLKPGDYYIALNSMDGYQISGEEVKVKVKENLEYTIMEDISLLIKTEDEIDAESEDTEVNDAVEDADSTEVKTAKKSDGKTRFGIDVSKWNKQIDWAAVKEDGVDFAIIRCGYRGSQSGALVEDPYFKENIKGANDNGISTGLYFFTQAVTEVEAVEEASMVLKLCQEYNVEYPIFIDTEGAGGNGRADTLSKEDRTAVCAAFCETIESAGYISGVYASRNWLDQNLDVGILNDYETWLAEYRSNPKYGGKYTMWQYTSNGSVNGIEGRVDLNLSYLGY